MQKFTAVTAFLTLAISTSAFAQSHSKEDEYACTPDVFRLCGSFIPNRETITACLIEKKRELSPGCQRVFSSSRTAQQAAPEKRRFRRGKSIRRTVPASAQ